MKKSDIFTFIAPNGVEVTGVVVAEINHKFNNATQKVECDMEHSREAIRTFIAWGFSEEEAINILDGKNPDGTEFIELPF